MLLTVALVRKPMVAGALLAATAMILTAPPGPAGAGPVAAPPARAPGDPDGTDRSPTLREVLEAAGRGYLEAEAKLKASKKRQVELNVQLAAVSAKLDRLLAEVGALAAVAYRTGRLNLATALLNSRSPDAFLERTKAAELMVHRDNSRLRDLTELRLEHRRNKQRIDAEVAEQARQLKIMAKKKEDAERALAAVGGAPTGGFVSASSPLAKSAPRDGDGSWPAERCIVDDPTTSGCVTPRTLHAYKQARAAGFQRHTSCYRSGGAGEHPKGRACDFAAQPNGFGGTATGGDRRYGNDLAAYFVRNADRLGVLYVIWFRQIWLPGTGWRSYSGANGDPSSDHENHVHLSVL